MLNLFTFILGIVGIFLIARYNRSNKLFWILVMSMLAGFVGGSIAARVTKSVEKKDNIAQSYLMQDSMVSPACADFKMPSETLVTYVTPPAGRITTVSDAMITFDPLSDIYESDVGNHLTPYNTS